jgi:F-type H+-transporting ATPase subunit delta
MSSVIASRRYASALLDVAEEGNFLDQATEDLSKVQEVLDQNKDLVKALKSPLIKGDAKARILQEIFRNDVGDKVMLFLKLLANKKRAGLLSEVIVEYSALLDEMKGIVNVGINSAVILNDEQAKDLVNGLASYTGKKVRAKMTLDEALIGGVTIKIGDTIIDGSVRHQLFMLHKALAGEAA